MGIDLSKAIENTKLLGDINEDLIITSETALAIYEINNKYILPPYDVINLSMRELSDRYIDNQFCRKIYKDDIYIINSIQVANPGKAMLDLLFSGREGDMYEFLDTIDQTEYSVTLNTYIKKYNLQKIMRNIMENYRLRDFKHMLDVKS